MLKPSDLRLQPAPPSKVSPGFSTVGILGGAAGVLAPVPTMMGVGIPFSLASGDGDSLQEIGFRLLEYQYDKIDVVFSSLQSSSILRIPIQKSYWCIGEARLSSFDVHEGYLAFQLGWSTYVRQPLPAAPQQESGLAVVAGSYNPPHQGHLEPWNRCWNCFHVYRLYSLYGGRKQVLQSFFCLGKTNPFCFPSDLSKQCMLKEIVRYLCARYERVHVVIGVNPAKKYDVSPYVRQELLRAMLRELNLLNVEVVIVFLGEIMKLLPLQCNHMHGLGLLSWALKSSTWFIRFKGSTSRWSYIWKHAQQHNAKIMYRGLRSFQKDGLAEKFLEAQHLDCTCCVELWGVDLQFLRFLCLVLDDSKECHRPSSAGW